MNENFSKQNTLVKSIRKMMIDDNVNTGVDVREIFYYVGNRIGHGSYPIAQVNPQITIDVNDGLQNQSIPTGDYWAIIKIWVDMDSEAPNDTINNIASRVIFLLHNRSAEMNLQYPVEKLRCRNVLKQSNLKSEDKILKSYVRVVVFGIKADDEILVC